ncbi:LysM peptidoglycan-binding domain-containing protein [Thermogutta sp.]|uniref:L,D-transpeptidase family protein n=1 Tax=Thermogutta sp. TaxID=1962930 RepID=UPI003220025B
METIKTIGVLVVLLVVGYLGYKAVTTPPPTPPRDDDGHPPPASSDLNVPIPELPAELAQQSGSATSSGGQPMSGPASDGRSQVATGRQPPPAFMGGTSNPDKTLPPGSSQGVVADEASNKDGEMASLPPQAAVASAMGRSPTDVLGPPGTIGTPNIASTIANTNLAPGEPKPQEPSSSSLTSDSGQNGIRKEFAEFLEAACRKLDRGEFVQVHTVLTAWYADPRLTPQEDAQLTDLLDQVAGTVVYSRQHLLENPYVVQPGDSLQSIAERYNVTPELLAKINGLSKPEDLVPGMTLKVLRGPFDAVIYLHRRELVLMLQGKYAGRFHIGIGTDARQCEGSYQVREKTRFPRYFTDFGVYEAGDPRNPLGPKWIGLEGRLGIHSTTDPAQFDNPQAPGSIFVSAKDMEDLFDILTIGSRVTILP